ncbi:hypothetical protein OS493_027790 [Desmophyllum pertusum]|uniref:GIY-YIG domain-containing protein n=1 Tax=Desmophyllum pertusum TaxID=174260 RepID=A0A9W9YX40_9CNID|nr:hypothetical protein OS493_027790 [Desmophyllum pertusum]
MTISADQQNQKAKDNHLQAFLEAVRSLGVSLRVYKVNEKWEWTSLLGGDKKILLRKLPDLFEKILPAHRVEKTRQLWVNFRELLESLNKENISEDDITAFETKALKWGKDMVAMSGSGPGYQHTVIITPYMHSLVFHVPVMMKKHGSMRQFSGQGVEKKNDDLRRYFHRKINRWDAATNLLLVEKRQEVLRACQREKRTYVKRKLSFWCEGGKEEAANKVVRISTASVTDVTLQNGPTTQQLTQAELKKMKVNELLALLTEQTGRMASGPSKICDKLIHQRNWFFYDSPKISQEGGIYVIGVKRPRERAIRYLYLGQSINIRDRIQQHKYGDQKIDAFVKKNFRLNGGKSLRVKWIQDPRHKFTERKYIRCVEGKLGYKLIYNVIRGNN